jgi:hypothetical protein
VTARAGWANGVALVPVALALALYTTGLEQSPPYLMHDELQFSLQARSIAETGRDLSGRRLPLYFTEPEFPAGRDPAIIYTTAAALQVVPFSEVGVKLPTALIGVLNVSLMIAAGRLVSGNYWAGALAALLLALTPIHFIRSRLVLSPIYSLPFILGWLIALGVYIRSGSRNALVASAALITASVYTYLASTVMAPLYFAITLLVAVRRDGRRVMVPLLATAALVATPLVIWSVAHPERYGQLIEAYQLAGSRVSSPMVPVVPEAPTGLRLGLGLVWQVFNPDFLFVSGDSSLVNSTRQAGLFPIAFAALIPIGLWAALRGGSAMHRIVIIGFLSAPLASLLSGSIQMNRLMFLIPFGVFAATIGAVALWERRGAPRIAAVVLVAAVPLQFASFHRHYLSAYADQAAPWFGGNVHEAVTTAAAGRGPVFLSARIPFVQRYWDFYAPPDRRASASHVTEAPASGPPGARLLCTAADPGCDAPALAWRPIAFITEPSGDPAFVIYEHQ